MNKKHIRTTGTNTIVFMIPITGYNDNWRFGRVCTQAEKRHRNKLTIDLKDRQICQRTKTRVFQPIPLPSLRFHTLDFLAPTH